MPKDQEGLTIGTWFAHSKSDPRWDGQASERGNMIDIHSHVGGYKAQKIALYGQPPDDLMWEWRRER